MSVLLQICCIFSEHLLLRTPMDAASVVSFLSDKYCEVIGHPHLFPTGRFACKVKRETQLSASKCFSQRLLNYSYVFASDSDYIFFAQAILQGLELNDQIKFDKHKVSTDSVTAGILKANFKEKVKQFIARDETYSFMRQIKGTQHIGENFCMR